MPTIPEELDVFKRPHCHMKKLVKDIEAELHCTDFADFVAMQALLSHLHSRFKQFKCHEEIENKYIVKELLPRLPSHTKATLENDIHSDNRLSDLVSMVDSGLQLKARNSEDRRQCVDFMEHLKSAIANFVLDFIPHMDEEEEVYLPLLLEYFSENELRELTMLVLELHQLPEQHQSVQIVQSIQQHHQSAPIQPEDTTNDMQAWSPSLLSLPVELILYIFSYLTPQELLRLLSLHSTLYHLALDSSLWQHLHPIRWARGYWHFFTPPPIQSEELVYFGLVDENNAIKEYFGAGVLINAQRKESMLEKEQEKESAVLKGTLEHLLPHVGHHVLTLDLAHSKSISDETAFRMLRLCPNLKYIDLSHTEISDVAFRGLIHEERSYWNLLYIDLSGCCRVTDTSLQRLAQMFSPSPSSSTSSSDSSCPFCMCGVQNTKEGGRGGGGGEKSQLENQLKCLVLSGCIAITDAGLRSLATAGLPCLHYLDLSGLHRVTKEGLRQLVAACPHLLPDLLFYCDNIMAGPYHDRASGCQNVGSSNLQCCRSAE